MPSRDRLHIFVRRPAVAEAYTSYTSGRGGARPPSPIREIHARRLIEEVRQAEQSSLIRRAAVARESGVTPTSEGMLVTFQSWPGFELELSTLDPARQPPELVAVVERGQDDERVQTAVVHVPDGSLSFFIKRLDQYAMEETRKGNPKNANMVDRIAEIRLATIEALWTDDPASFPEPKSTVWWEIWLRASDGHEVERLQAIIMGMNEAHQKQLEDISKSYSEDMQTKLQVQENFEKHMAGQEELKKKLEAQAAESKKAVESAKSPRTAAKANKSVASRLVAAIPPPRKTISRTLTNVANR